MPKSHVTEVELNIFETQNYDDSELTSKHCLPACVRVHMR
jgi:hypothetical protein